MLSSRGSSRALAVSPRLRRARGAWTGPSRHALAVLQRRRRQRIAPARGLRQPERLRARRSRAFLVLLQRQDLMRWTHRAAVSTSCPFRATATGAYRLCFPPVGRVNAYSEVAHLKHGAYYRLQATAACALKSSLPELAACAIVKHRVLASPIVLTLVLLTLTVASSGATASTHREPRLMQRR